MRRTVGGIAAALGFEADGATDLEIVGAADPASAGPGDLALSMDPKYLGKIAKGRARAAMTPPGTDWRALGLQAVIFAPRARYALAGATQLFDSPHALGPGVHPSAVVAADARLEDDVAIGPLTVIGSGAVVAAGARVLGQATIGPGAEVGPDALIHPGVRIGRGVRIGARAIIHANASLGADGFSFVTPEPSAVETARADAGAAVAVAPANAVWARIHSLGALRIGDDVEIGACAAIDRGTVRDTRIGRGTKIDNLVMIGHNVAIGEDCLLCGHVGVAGSVEIGDRVVLGGKVGIADHARIGSDVLVMANSGVAGAVKPKSVIGGVPAVPRNEYADMMLALRRLPRLMRELTSLKAAVRALGGDRRKAFSDDDASG